MREAVPDQPVLHLFEGYGIELEYMLVDASSLAVFPATDQVIKAVVGEIASDYEEGEIAWSNELVLHVIELKTNGPAASLGGLASLFQADLVRIGQILAPLGGRLMPTAMHPLMDPLRETRLWPHDYSPVYGKFDEIFDCRGHGWSNLQSVHVNLPFASDDEFARLHAAIRLLLPIMPALVASSPVVEGRVNGVVDNRMEFYRHNARRIPSVSGEIIPEPVFTRQAYEEHILQRIYRDVDPFDPGGILRHEWVNARGTIARFDRMALEIRVLDIQECPRADLATTALIVAALRALVEERWAPLSEQMAWGVEPLAKLLRRVIVSGERAVVEERGYPEMFGMSTGGLKTVGDVWRHLAQVLLPGSDGSQDEWREALDLILEKGPLSRRIMAALGPDPNRMRVLEVYRELCDCLDQGALFRGAD